MVTGKKDVPIYKATLSLGAILPIYSVILGEPAISPTPKINMEPITKNGSFVNKVSDIPMAQTRKPEIMELKGFHFMIIVDTIIWKMIMYSASTLVIYSAFMVPSAEPIFSASQGHAS